MLYSKTVKKNIEQRINFIQSAKKDAKLRAVLMDECRRDCLFFINMFGWTYDPRLEDSHIPFVTYDYQDTHIEFIIDCVETEKDMCYDKSRDMGASWLAVAIQAWGFLFKGWSQLYGSYDQDHVDKKGDLDAHFQRLEYFMNRLPSWMKPKDLLIKFMTVSSQKLGCDISGDCGKNFGTGGRRRVVWLDEYSYWENDANAFRKTRDITNCRIFFGTPNGRFNIFGKIMKNDKDYVHLDIVKKSLHWTVHPKKAEDVHALDGGQKRRVTRDEAYKLWCKGVNVTSSWYEKQRRTRTRLDMAKEIDLSYDDSVSNAVYPHFLRDVKILDKCEFNPKLRLYTSWDFGRDMVAIIWFQKDFATDSIYIIDAFQKSGEKIDFFAAFVTGIPTPGYFYNEEELEMMSKHADWKFAYSNHFGDPYNATSKSVVTDSTIKDELERMGIYLSTKRDTTVEERIKKTTLAMNRMKINRALTDFIQSIIQSRYPEIKETAQLVAEKTKPVHDINSHFRTCLEYGIDNEPGIYKDESFESFEEAALDRLASPLQNNL